MAQIFVQFGITAENPEEVIRILSDTLYHEGCVTKEYADAAVEREKLYPTGLPIPCLGVAIPHAGAEHALKEAYAIGKLQQTISFTQMGEIEKQVAAELIVLIAIPNPDKQLPAISRLVAMFSNAELVARIRDCETEAELQEFFKHHLLG